MRWLFFACAAISVLTTLAVVGVLSIETFNFFQQVPAADFLFGTRWTPLLEPKSYGILPLLFGTTLIVIGAAIVALPVGLACAIYLSEYAGVRTREVVKPILEILAGIPTIVYGFFAITFVTPILRTLIPSTEVFNAASAGIVVGIMVLPMVASLCDDALRAVPNALRDGAYSLGATSFEVTARIVVPASLSGIFAAFVLAISRAIGETMAVTLAAGATPNLTLNPLESIQTMTAYIVQVSLGDTPAGTLSYQTLFAVGAVLFSMTLILNLIANAVMNRYRDVYE
ncbi:MAG: phosphate ABC transporter permease subunit PstC [Pseudomonadales bacterium]|nr:phosphate ABC transporter permease subunit PstC [Pseudomonadales bacterium]